MSSRLNCATGNAGRCRMNGLHVSGCGARHQLGTRDALFQPLARPVHSDSTRKAGICRAKRLWKPYKHIVDKGIQDIQDVAVRNGVSSSPETPLRAFSDVWTFPICLITYSTLVITWASVLADSPYPSWLCGTVGFFLGILFSLAHRAATKRAWRLPEVPLNVVVTGGTRGLGRAIVREFIRQGDNVFVAARSSVAIAELVEDLQGECQRPGQVKGVICDVSRPSSVACLAAHVKGHYDGASIDVWINNAGVSGSFKPFLDATPEDLRTVTETNLLGSLLCTRAAMRAMEGQAGPGHIFNMDGAGADGLPTPQYAAYGATKAGIAHVMGSAAMEAEGRGGNVKVHTLSPGMVLTDLILDGATNKNKQIFNILCEQPEVAAAYLVPRVRTVVARGDSGVYIRYLTSFTALTKLLAAPFLLGRHFSPDGETLYEENESERLSCKSTERAMEKSRRRDLQLQYTYAICLCLAVFALSLDPDTISDLGSGRWVTGFISRWRL